MENIEQILSDTLLERPIGFEIGDSHFYLYPVTLGKQYLVAPLLKQLEINSNILSVNTHVEFLRVAREKPELCCRIIAIHSLEGKGCMDNEKVCDFKDFYGANLDMKQIALLIEMIFSSSNYETLVRYFGIDKELKDMASAREAQKQGSTLSFCGKSIYGTMIDNLASKYGWTMEYILWGISYDNIRLLLADSVKTVYLTNEERQKSGIYDKSKVLDGNNPESWVKIKQMEWYKRAVKNGDISSY